MERLSSGHSAELAVAVSVMQTRSLNEEFWMSLGSALEVEWSWEPRRRLGGLWFCALTTHMPGAEFYRR